MFAMVLHSRFSAILESAVFIWTNFDPIQPILDPPREANSLIDALALIMFP
jgi:hypothetical protein